MVIPAGRMVFPFSLQPKYLSSDYHVYGCVARLRKSHRTLLKILHDHGPLHRPEMQITVVGKGSRIFKNMFKTLPRFVHRQSAIKMLSSTRTIVHTTGPAGHTMWFLRPIGVYPHNFFTSLDRDLRWHKKRRRPKQNNQSPDWSGY